MHVRVCPPLTVDMGLLSDYHITMNPLIFLILQLY